MAVFKMKPCPFCGETPDQTNFVYTDGYKWGAVGCPCGGTGPDVRTKYDDSAFAPWHEKAIAEWDKRAYKL